MDSNTHSSVYTLPDDHCRLIGQFITRWAHLEWQLRRAQYDLLGLGQKIGRVAVREPRVVDYLTMIEETAGLKDVSISVNWKQLKKIFQTIETWRDRFAHGVWLEIDGAGDPCVQLTTGKTVVKLGGPAVRSRIAPRAVRVTVKELENAIAGVDKAVELVKEMRTEIEAQVRP